MFENSGFDALLDSVRKLHAFMGEKFYAIVLVRIMRRGDDDADMKIVLADKAGNAGSGENSSKGNGSAAFQKAGGNDASNVRTGFASVSTDEGVGRSVVAM